MSNRPIDYIFIEGPDCSGKTTLYEKIHKKSNYKWNIQDRSALSMLVHAKYYERDEFRHVEQLRNEINNLNNIILILLPEWDVVFDRFQKRGDEIQNFISLKKIYSLFKEAAEELKGYPNVIVLNKEVNDLTVDYLIKTLREYETPSTEKIQKECLQSCFSKEGLENIGLNFTLYDDGSFDDIDEGDLLYEEEVDYYQDIMIQLKNKINNELAGKNPYNRKETKFSRRFIYNSDTCISLAHFLYREEGLDCKFFLRSSNVKDTLYYDLNFMKYMSSEVYKTIGAQGKFCRMSFTINSGHVLLED